MADTSAIDLDTRTQEILLAASRHDVAALKPFLRTPGAANIQDPETGFTPLHAAIAACEKDEETNQDDQVDIEKAKATVKELFMSGAIWNDLDMQGETPGCLAWRLGQKELYELVVEAGVRAEMLLNLMGGYEPLGDEDSEDEDEDEEVSEEPKDGEQATAEESDSREPYTKESTSESHTATSALNPDVNSATYLQSNLTFTDDKLLDEDANGVMMAWESDIMRRSVDLLLPSEDPEASSKPASGKRILNIGFGMGIIDRMFASTSPSSHHIIEAHPAVIQKLKSSPTSFGLEPNRFVLHEGKWQDVIPSLISSGETFDAIYFDTFGEDYSALKYFFSEYVVALLDPDGKFGFFNGLGADRRVCYDVYCRVVELDLCEAGLDVEWTDVEVKELGGEGKGEWEGVRRRYWTLENYRLPICSFMG